MKTSQGGWSLDQETECNLSDWLPTTYHDLLFLCLTSILPSKLVGTALKCAAAAS